MPKRIELKPLAELGKGYAVIDADRIEVRVSGVMGALKAWLIGKENRPIGNLVGGKLVKDVPTEDFHALLITQSGRQMFYGQWREKEQTEEIEEKEEIPLSPLPNFNWEEIKGAQFPSNDEKVRYALSSGAFYRAFKKQGSYLFAKDGERFAIAVRREEGEENPFPYMEGALRAGDYDYVVIE